MAQECAHGTTKGMGKGSKRVATGKWGWKWIEHDRACFQGIKPWSQTHVVPDAYG